MAKKTFETAIARLEQITEELENGDLSLDASLKKFDEGIKLAEYCNARLSEARTKVEILLEKKRPDGSGTIWRGRCRRLSITLKKKRCWSKGNFIGSFFKNPDHFQILSAPCGTVSSSAANV